MRASPSAQPRPLVADTEWTYARSSARSCARLRERIGVAVDRGQRAGLLVAARFGLLKPLPHADRNEGEQHRVNDADHGENETGAVVVRGSNSTDVNRATRYPIASERETKPPTITTPGRHGWERVQPVDQLCSFSSQGNGNSEPAPKVVDSRRFRHARSDQLAVEDQPVRVLAQAPAAVRSCA